MLYRNDGKYQMNNLRALEMVTLEIEGRVGELLLYITSLRE